MAYERCVGILGYNT
jgi:hypothetical protein